MKMEIKQAKRLKQPALIALWGGSSSGKTYSALQLAKGLVEKGKKIGVIDTENRRALLHAEKECGWFHIDLQPKFTSDRYIEAFRAFENTGEYGCIIVDSYSMAWDGEGGVLEQADTSTYRGLSKWISPKIQHKRMVNTFLRSPIHVIFCMRARMGMAQVGSKKDTEIYRTGLTPITEKSFLYEMGVSILIGMDHKPMFGPSSDKYFCSQEIPYVKAPPGIIENIRPGEYLTEDHGRMIRNWFDGVDPRDLFDDAKRVASRGADAFRGWWSGLDAHERKSIKPSIDEFKLISEQADACEKKHAEVLKKELQDINEQNEEKPVVEEDGQNPFLKEKVIESDTQFTEHVGKICIVKMYSGDRHEGEYLGQSGKTGSIKNQMGKRVIFDITDVSNIDVM